MQRHARRCLTFASLGLAGALLWLGCLEPTQMRLSLTTDECARAPRVAIDVGTSREALLDQYKSRKATQTRNCVEGDSLGTLVLTPGTAGPNVDVYVSVRAAFDGKDPLDCLPGNDFAGCVIARRRFRYASATPLELPVRLLAECIDVPCTEREGQTCSTGRQCVSESTSCEAQKTCVIGDAGGSPRSDAGPDSAIKDGSSGDATTQTSGTCLAGDAVLCGLEKNKPPLCRIDEGKACCANVVEKSNGTCQPIGKCPQGTQFQQYCCTDSAQCGAPTSGKACCYENENTGTVTLDVYRCRDVGACVGKAILCGDGSGACPTGSKCGVQPSNGPFFACISN